MIKAAASLAAIIFLFNLGINMDKQAAAKNVEKLNENTSKPSQTLQTEEPTYDISSSTKLTDEEIELVAWVTMGEAEGECEIGKRLVIDTILNRVDSEDFPNTVKDVIYQENQFECVWNGRLDRCFATDEAKELVKQECKSRLCEDCLFFCAGDYGYYGTPMMQVDNHYFSSM